MAADDRRQRGAQPAPLGRAAHGARTAGASRHATTSRPRRRCSPAESRAALLGALAGLRDDDRLVLGCRYLLELSEAETAAALGVKPGTVKSRTSRALDRLRGEAAVTPDLEQAPARARRRLARHAGPRDGRACSARARRRAARASMAAAPPSRVRARGASSRRCSSAARWRVSPAARTRRCSAGSGIESVEIKREEPSGDAGRGAGSRDPDAPSSGSRVPVLQARELGTPGVYETLAARRLDAPPRSSTTGRSSCRPSARRPRRSSRRRSAPARRPSDSTSTARPPTGSPARTGSRTSRRRGFGVRAAADRREHAARRARRAAAADRGRASRASARSRSPAQFSDGSGGIVASSA